jgi:hypothetical protein
LLLRAGAFPELLQDPLARTAGIRKGKSFTVPNNFQGRSAEAAALAEAL